MQLWSQACPGVWQPLHVSKGPAQEQVEAAEVVANFVVEELIWEVGEEEKIGGRDWENLTNAVMLSLTDLCTVTNDIKYTCR